MDAPIYIHVPSVRPAILSFLSRWFIHAIEARARENATEEIMQVARKERNTAVRGRLEKIVGHLKVRNLLGREHIGSEIHFVIVDNAAFYLEKPVKKTHTLKALSLAKALNAIGNKYGVFIHYITPIEMKTLFPSPIPDEHPFVLRLKNKPKVSPGAACNVALAYIRAYNEKKHGPGSTVMLVKMDDDMTPPIGRKEWQNSKQARNFFMDQQRILKGRSEETKSGYIGYIGNSRGSKWTDKGHKNYSWPLLVGKLEDASFYSTSAGERMDTKKLEKLQGVGSPDYLIHAGKERTYDARLCLIGSFWPWKNPEGNAIIQKAPEKLVTTVVRKSGIHE